MRDYSKVSPRFWTGETGKQIRQLGPEAQVVAFYLFTCSSANMLGLYYLSLPTLCHETGRPLEGALKALQSLENIGFAYYDEKTEHVYLPNMAREQIGEVIKERDNRHDAVIKELKTLRKIPFFNAFVEKYRDAFRLHSVELNENTEGAIKGLGRGVAGALPPLRSQNQIQEQIQEQKQKGDVREVAPVENLGTDLAGQSGPTQSNSLDSSQTDAPAVAAARRSTSERRENRTAAELVFKHWQVTWGHEAAKFDSKRRKRIEARLAQGFTVEQLCNAITGFRHSAWHTGMDPNGDGKIYDKIETLLRDAGQVEEGMRLHANPPRANGNGHANGSEAFAAWDRAYDHARKGDWRKGALGDPRIDRVVAYIGGYRQIAMSNNSDVPFLRQQFIKAWKEGAP